jgi:hypothetical protein
MTPFARIMRDVVEQTPGAIGGAFAASDGEMVDSFATVSADEWALITAHYGVILANMHAAFGCWHFGSVEYFIAQHGRFDVMVHAVDQGYYAIMVMATPSPLSLGMSQLKQSVVQLRREMS